MKSHSLKVDDDIVLKLPNVNQANDFFKVIDRQRTYLGVWLPWVERTKTVEDITKFLKDGLNYTNGGQQLITNIFYKNNICGNISFVRIDKTNHIAEIGYWIDEQLQGKGIISKSCKKLIHYGFEKMDLNRIEIKVGVENTKSLSIPRRLGFKEEGILRNASFNNNNYHDIFMFSLLKIDTAYQNIKRSVIERNL